MNSVLEFFKEEFTVRELKIRATLLVCAFPIGLLAGYLIEKI